MLTGGPFLIGRGPKKGLGVAGACSQAVRIKSMPQHQSSLTVSFLTLGDAEAEAVPPAFGDCVPWTLE
jgi:hypothetical protein